MKKTVLFSKCSYQFSDNSAYAGGLTLSYEMLSKISVICEGLWTGTDMGWVLAMLSEDRAVCSVCATNCSSYKVGEEKILRFVFEQDIFAEDAETIRAS